MSRPVFELLPRKLRRLLPYLCLTLTRVHGTDQPCKDQKLFETRLGHRSKLFCSAKLVLQSSSLGSFMVDHIFSWIFMMRVLVVKKKKFSFRRDCRERSRDSSFAPSKTVCFSVLLVKGDRGAVWFAKCYFYFISTPDQKLRRRKSFQLIDILR